MGDSSNPIHETVWRKSSRCSNSACVEATVLGGNTIALRSTERPDQLVTYSREEWDVFVEAVKAGEFDLDTF